MLNLILALTLSQLAVPNTVGTAPLIAEPAGTLSHFHGYSGKYLDTKANAWTTTTPTPRPAVASALAPRRPSIGGFSTATRPTLGSGTDVLDVANYEMCVVFQPAVISSASWFYGNGNFTTTGVHYGLAAGGACTANIGGTNLTTTNIAKIGKINTCCMGRNGTTGYVMMNGGATVSGTVTASTDTARIANLGSGNSAASPMTGTIYEMIFVGAVYSDSWARSVCSTIAARRLTYK